MPIHKASHIPRNAWISEPSGPALGIIQDSELWRNACSVTAFLIPAASAAS
jgi:hypothetical protein